jgi:GGDEF domain-containing protein
MKKALSHITFHAHRRQLPPLYDEGTEWYQGWYFDLRLEEEVSRAARYSLPLVVIAIQLGEHPRADDPEFQRLMRSVRGTRLRRSDIPAIRDEQELLICLTQTRSEQATTVVQRLRRAVTSYTPNIGIASFPEDGSHPGSLLAIAENRALSDSVFPAPLRAEPSERRRI